MEEGRDVELEVEVEVEDELVPGNNVFNSVFILFNSGNLLGSVDCCEATVDGVDSVVDAPEGFVPQNTSHGLVTAPFIENAHDWDAKLQISQELFINLNPGINEGRIE